SRHGRRVRETGRRPSRVTRRGAAGRPLFSIDARLLKRHYFETLQSGATLEEEEELPVLRRRRVTVALAGVVVAAACVSAAGGGRGGAAQTPARATPAPRRAL